MYFRKNFGVKLGIDPLVSKSGIPSPIPQPGGVQGGGGRGGPRGSLEHIAEISDRPSSEVRRSLKPIFGYDIIFNFLSHN